MKCPERTIAIEFSAVMLDFNATCKIFSDLVNTPEDQSEPCATGDCGPIESRLSETDACGGPCADIDDDYIPDLEQNFDDIEDIPGNHNIF